jgi:cyclopropane-fatty-acyl-phospholipid synthase
MSLVATAIRLVEQTPLPDLVTKRGIDFIVGRARRPLSQLPASCECDFARELESCPIASHTDAANAQHYELPPDFSR